MHTAATAAQGRAAALGTDWDVLLLDLALPGGDGMDILAALRAARRHQPVLILTARGAEAQRVQGLRAGADDYLVKPFSPAELMARIEALLRRSGAKAQPLGGRVRLGAVTIDFARRSAQGPGLDANLSPQEAELLRLLAERRQQVLPRSEVQALLWPDQPMDLESRALDMALRRLRDKLGDAGAQLVTVRGVGLRLDGVEEVA
ncbi:MAG: DNA-binding response regulator [Planctomycetota bacterium]|nr:MAG: DNA-binding response regulator [Planctomycetota bacterium]